MSNSKKRFSSIALACVMALGVTVTATPPAKAADPAVYVVGGILTYMVVRSLPKPKKPAYTVIARYCEDTKTGLYHKC